MSTKPDLATPGWCLLTQHWPSLTGTARVATAAISVLFVESHEIWGHRDNPYVGILLLLIVPFVLFVGLVLISVGVYLSKREIREGLAARSIDRKAALRWVVLFMGVATVINGLLEHR